jgi:hypothetical protein
MNFVPSVAGFVVVPMNAFDDDRLSEAWAREHVIRHHLADDEMPVRIAHAEVHVAVGFFASRA